MFREMRRKRQQLPEEECVAILERGTSGVLAVLGDDGYPYAVPISYVYTNGKIYFHCAREGHKVDAIRTCEKVSFCVVDKDEVIPEKYTTLYRSVIAFGRARIVEDEDEKLSSAEALGDKYYPNHPKELEAEISCGIDRMLMVRIDIDHLTGKEAIELVKEMASQQRISRRKHGGEP
ncbi:MAG: pyridoxamine 5'-phosphate oxidase family protein [Coriobacteriales bacterium]|jgi:nitroimidazol reductase NimA-like FMN-containing flavoprotein (pyridoxamine 5'-phosphate oxidase superfamily)